MPKQITENERLAAIGLFTMARTHNNKAVEYERALLEMLGIEHGSHVSDVIWMMDGTINIQEFDDALKREGVKVV